MATAAQVADDGRYLAFVPFSGSYLLGLLRASVSSRITLSNDMNIKIIYLGSLNSVNIRYEFTSLWSEIRMRRHTLPSHGQSVAASIKAAPLKLSPTRSEDKGRTLTYLNSSI